MKKDLKKNLIIKAENAQIPDVLDSVKQADFSLYQTDEPIEPVKKLRPISVYVRASIAVCTAFILTIIFFSVVFPQLFFDNTVFANINMSLNNSTYLISINKSERVIEVSTQENDNILQSINYKKLPYEIFITDLLKAHIDNDTLDEKQLNAGAVTFLISCHDEQAKHRLQTASNNSISAAKNHCKNKHNNHENHDH